MNLTKINKAEIQNHSNRNVLFRHKNGWDNAFLDSTSIYYTMKDGIVKAEWNRFDVDEISEMYLLPEAL